MALPTGGCPLVGWGAAAAAPLAAQVAALGPAGEQLARVRVRVANALPTTGEQLARVGVAIALPTAGCPLLGWGALAWGATLRHLLAARGTVAASGLRQRPPGRLPGDVAAAVIAAAAVVVAVVVAVAVAGRCPSATRAPHLPGQDQAVLLVIVPSGSGPPKPVVPPA